MLALVQRAAEGDGDGGDPPGVRGRAEQLKELEHRFALQARSRAQEQLPGFNADAPPAHLPDYINGSVLSDVLLEDQAKADAPHEEVEGEEPYPGIYQMFRRATTRGGVTFGTCIKPGMDVTPKMEMELAKTIGRRFESEQRPVGLVAGDDECYEMFDALFSEVMRRCNEGREAPGVAAQPIELEPHKVRDTNDVDPAGRFVVSCTVDGRRNIATVALLPGANTNDRREAEEILSTAACGGDDEGGSEEEGAEGEGGGSGPYEGLAAPNAGVYYPMPDSWSHVGMQGGMEPGEAEQLKQREQLFERCRDVLRVSSGYGRDWPDARGVYRSEDERLFMWVNEQDHCRLFSSIPSADIQQVPTKKPPAIVSHRLRSSHRRGFVSQGFARWCAAMIGLEEGLKREGNAWARDRCQFFLEPPTRHSEHLAGRNPGPKI